MLTCLDFKNQTIRKNHRAFYDFLCQTGGEAALKKLLAEGKTCLTADAKDQRIKGTERYFLKTNAGDSTALASILWGVQSLHRANKDFDPKLVSILSREDARSEAEEAAEEPEDDEAAEPDMSDVDFFFQEEGAKEEDLLPAHSSVSLVQKDGLCWLYDNDENRFFTLPCPDAPGAEVGGMLRCEKLEAPGEAPEWAEADAPLGWKYQLEEDGLWGWISADCTRLSPPVLQAISPRRNETGNLSTYLLAWKYTGLSFTDGTAPLAQVIPPSPIENRPPIRWIGGRSVFPYGRYSAETM